MKMKAGFAAIEVESKRSQRKYEDFIAVSYLATIVLNAALPHLLNENASFFVEGWPALISGVAATYSLLRPRR